MLIFEVFGPKHVKEELDYDLHDDLIYFMNADPEFYRTSYFPLQSRFHQHCKSGKSVNPIAFKNIVNKAYESYKKKFPLPQLEESLREDELNEICSKLHQQETEAFNYEAEQQQEKNETP